jgi:WD40-like Beta Propeller Repeat
MRWFPVVLALAAIGAACSATSQHAGFGANGTGGSGAGGAGAATGSGGTGLTLGIDGGGPGSCGGGTITNATGGGTINLQGAPQTIQFTANVNGSPATASQWLVNDTLVGSIGNDGVFHANGYVGGEVVITAVTSCGQINTNVTFDVQITDNSGNLSSADQTALQAGGPPSSSFKFLYPYDGTVFARGLSAPLLQFGNGMNVTSTVTEAYLKMTTTHFSYQQFAGSSSPAQVVIPAAVWTGATLSTGPTDKLTVAVSLNTGSAVTGPLTESWSVAQANLNGYIYYSTYKSPLLPWNNSTGTGGGILRVQPGSTAQIVSSGCIVCHSVSAAGSVMAAAVGPDLSNPTSSETANVSPNSATPTPRGTGTAGQEFAFAGLTPDGTLALTNGVPALGPPYVPHGLQNDYQSSLVNTQTGAAVASPSLTSLVKHAQCPAFSPDGKHVAFVNGDLYPQRVLSIMDFDGTSVFSNLMTLLTETNMTTAWGAAQPKTIAWPSFMPDSNGILFHEGDSFDSSGFTGGTTESNPQYAEIRLIQLNGTVNQLNTLNGRDASGNSTLPYGEAIENNMDYEPNVMPLPVGGYYWVVFTSRRTYGNVVAPGRAATSTQYDDPSQDPWGSNAGPSPRKKLWVAAIDINYASPTNLDPSHPAFYLDGQELESANMRAFAALAPCAGNGQSCMSGTDCCSGFCRQTSTDPMGNPVLQCVVPPAGCSNVGELCMTASDCCDTTNLCINGHCALQTPTQ